MLATPTLRRWLAHILLALGTIALIAVLAQYDAEASRRCLGSEVLEGYAISSCITQSLIPIFAFFVIVSLLLPAGALLLSIRLQRRTKAVAGIFLSLMVAGLLTVSALIAGSSTANLNAILLPLNILYAYCVWGIFSEWRRC